MRRIALCCVLLLALLPASAGAQRRDQPQLLLTIFGGVTTGSSLWLIGRQPLSLLEDPSRYDTLRLARALESAVSVGASAMYFPSPHVGLSAEIFFMGFGLDDQCEFVYRDPVSGRDNDWSTDQICADITERGGSASTVAFTAGGTYRFAPRAFASPYLRLHAGFATRNASTVELTGRFTDGTGITQARLIIADPDRSSLTPTLNAGLGVMVPVGRGYQVGLELRDNLLSVPKVTGPASVLAVAPTATTLKHGVSLVVRFDIVLERRRGRRY
jgi:hypothetical protein